MKFEAGQQLPTRTVVARNTAAAEAGSIHDDAYAARLGYRGGLVPGVTLLAYLTPALIAAFGEAWPQRGRLRARFVRPAYDGDALAIAGRVADDGAIECRIDGPDGAVCVEAHASCSAVESIEAKPWRTSIPVAGPSTVAPDGSLPELSLENLAAGQELSPLTYRLSLAQAIAWAADASDDSAWYRDTSPFGGPIIHPAFFARDAIALLRHNFAYKATVHAETDLAYQGPGYPERDHTLYGNVADLYERNGNSYVVLDALTVDQDGREIVRNRHTSVIRLRGRL